MRIEAEGGELIGYRFSADTVKRLPEFYQRVRDLPARDGMEPYHGALERFQLRPGFAAPAVVVSVVQGLPPVWFRTFAGEPWWKWTALALVLLGAGSVFALAKRAAAALDDGTRSTAGLTALVRPALAVLAIVLCMYLRHVAVDIIRLTGVQRDLILALLAILAHAAAVWLIFLVAARAADAVIRVREMGIYALDTQLVRLVYGPSSLDVEIFAYVTTRDFSEFLAIQEDLNLRMKDIVEGCGASFAFPSQTLYVESSHGPDAQLTRAAEQEIERMREENRLPFPDYDERARRKMSGTLDYPPEGSPARPGL